MLRGDGGDKCRSAGHSWTAARFRRPGRGWPRAATSCDRGSTVEGNAYVQCRCCYECCCLPCYQRRPSLQLLRLRVAVVNAPSGDYSVLLVVSASTPEHALVTVMEEMLSLLSMFVGPLPLSALKVPGPPLTPVGPRDSNANPARVTTASTPPRHNQKGTTGARSSASATKTDKATSQGRGSPRLTTVSTPLCALRANLHDMSQ